MTAIMKHSRGCPRCGSHNTDSLREGSRAGKRIYVQWCRTCRWRWEPCGIESEDRSNPCRGYRLLVRHPDGPTVIGCEPCGVSTRIARTWPDAWRALAKVLDEYTLESTVDQVLGEPFPREAPGGTGGTGPRGTR